LWGLVCGRWLGARMRWFERRRGLGLVLDLGDASHPLSVFGKKTQAIRVRSERMFVAILDGTAVPADVREPLGRALWLAHLGVFLHFVHDRSKGQTRTHRIVETLVELAGSGLPLLAYPLTLPIRARLLELMGGCEPHQERNVAS